MQPFGSISQGYILSTILAISPVGLELVTQALGRAQAARFEHQERPTIDKELRQAIINLNWSEAARWRRIREESNAIN